MKSDFNNVERLVSLLSEHGLTEITLKDGNNTISIKREVNVGVAPAAPMPVAQVAPKPVVKVEEVKKEVSSSRKAIKSPMVGTFYEAPDPNSAPFVKVGDTVKASDVVCIIEAMKHMNNIEAEEGGKIVEICVKNGESVEFGQVLMYLE